MNIEYYDLAETSAKRPNAFLRSAGRYFGIIFLSLAALGFGTLLLVSSLPEKSAFDIVSMQGYGGQQSTTAFEPDKLTATTLHEIPASVAAATDLQYQPEPANVPIVSETIGEMKVKVQWSIVRSAPNKSAQILASLPLAETVTVLDNSQESWFQVRVNDGTQTSGYIHRSLLEEI